MGTAFLTTKESGAHKVWKKAILNSKKGDTVVTASFSGKEARGLKNQYIEDARELENDFPEYPITNTITKSIRSQAKKNNDKDCMSLWCGEKGYLAEDLSVCELMDRLIVGL